MTKITIDVLQVEPDDVRGEPVATLLHMIDAALGEVPPEDRARVEIDLGGTLSLWYCRDETEAERQERATYEALRLKYDKPPRAP